MGMGAQIRRMVECRICPVSPTIAVIQARAEARTKQRSSLRRGSVSSENSVSSGDGSHCRTIRLGLTRACVTARGSVQRRRLLFGDRSPQSDSAPQLVAPLAQPMPTQMSTRNAGSRGGSTRTSLRNKVLQRVREHTHSQGRRRRALHEGDDELLCSRAGTQYLEEIESDSCGLYGE